MPRIDFPGLFHHVIVRGIERRRIFRKLSDHFDFVERLERILTETQTFCYTWALMPNHVHLLLQTGATKIATVMQRLLTGYSVSFNLRYRRAGHLFQNRYKDVICQEDAYFLQLVRYIALNPVRAGMIQTPEELARYPWTGHSAIMGNVARPWQITQSVLDRFGPNVLNARTAYESFVVETWNHKEEKYLEGGGLIRSSGGLSQAIDGLRRKEIHAYDSRILGDSDFVERVLKEAEQEESDYRSLKSLEMNDLVHAAADLTGMDPLRINAEGKGHALIAAKSMVAFGGIVWLKKSATEMGKILGFSTSSASRAYLRGRRLAEDMNLQGWLESQDRNYVP